MYKHNVTNEIISRDEFEKRILAAAMRELLETDSNEDRVDIIKKVKLAKENANDQYSFEAILIHNFFYLIGSDYTDISSNNLDD